MGSRIGETPKSVVRSARLEPDLLECIEEDPRFGTFQKFVDHYIYKLAPERRPIKKGKNKNGKFIRRIK